MAIFDLNVDGLPRLDASLGRLNSQILQTPKIMRRESIPRLRKVLKEAFKTQGASTGVPWAQIKSSTLLRKAIGKTILRDSDELFWSLTRAKDPQNVTKVFSNQLQFGSTLEYLKFHEEGTSRMPQRKIFRFTQAQQRHIFGDPVASAYQKALQ